MVDGKQLRTRIKTAETRKLVDLKPTPSHLFSKTLKSGGAAGWFYMWCHYFVGVWAWPIDQEKHYVIRVSLAITKLFASKQNGVFEWITGLTTPTSPRLLWWKQKVNFLLVPLIGWLVMSFIIHHLNCERLLNSTSRLRSYPTHRKLTESELQNKYVATMKLDK